MIARPKVSQNEWKAAEIGAFEVGNVAPLSCPGAILQIHCEAHLDDDDPRSPGGVPLEESKDADLEAPLLDGAADASLTTEEKPRRRRLASLARVTADHLGLGTTLDACYEKNFWFGQSTKAKFTLDVMRLATFPRSGKRVSRRFRSRPFSTRFGRLLDERSSLGTVSKRGCVSRNARAREHSC
jgi:hypothetical protein